MGPRPAAASRPDSSARTGRDWPVLPGNFLVNVPFLQGFGPAARQAELIASLAGAEDQGEGYGVLGNVPLVFLLGGEIRADGLCDLDLPAVVQGEGARPGEQAQEKARGMAEEGQRTS